MRQPNVSPLHFRNDNNTLDLDTRNPNCKGHGEEPAPWTCPGCAPPQKPRNHPMHEDWSPTCRWYERITREGKPRLGAHPRVGRVRAVDNDARGVRSSHDADGKGIGIDEEEAGEQASEPSSSSRGPDAEPRVRRAWKESGSQPGLPSDWTDFDVTRTLRALRTGGATPRTKLLKKLHLRWWHAPAATMQHLLHQCGVPHVITNLIPAIVDTCSVCRMWSKPLPASIASINTAEQFNVQVEVDLSFYLGYVIFNAVCRCTRWHATCDLTDWNRRGLDLREAWPDGARCTEALVDALHTCWVSIHGPMKELLVDGERGLVTAGTAHQYFQQRGIKLQVRAPHQHARFVERRQALLGEVLRRGDSQLVDEGLLANNKKGPIPFKYRLEQATTAGNALISVNNTTPYNAVYGRQPSLLPDLNLRIDPKLDPRDTPLPGLIRDSQRMREIFVQKMVEGTTEARVGRILSGRGKYQTPVEEQNYQPGDLVEFRMYDVPKHTEAWDGPATVVDCTELLRGSIKLKHKAGYMSRKVQDVRRWIGFLAMYTLHFLADKATTATSVIRQMVERLSENTSRYYGWMPDENGKWNWTACTLSDSGRYKALMHYAKVNLQLKRCVAAQIVRGSVALAAHPEYATAFVIWWGPDDANTYTTSTVWWVVGLLDPRLHPRLMATIFSRCTVVRVGIRNTQRL